jgi:hypothetical protein
LVLSGLSNDSSSVFSRSSGNGLSSIGLGFTVEFKEFGGVDLGGFEDFDLSDKDVLERENFSAFLLDGEGNGIRNEFLDKISKFTVGFVGDNILHFLSNKSALSSLSISGLSQLVLSSSSESNDEDSQDVSVKSFNFDIGFNKGLPFSNQRSIFVSSKIKSVKVGESRSSNDFVDSKVHFLVSLVFVFLEVSQAGFDDSTLQGVRGNVSSLSSVDASPSNISVSERGRGLNTEPFLLGEGVSAKEKISTKILKKWRMI